MPDSENGTPAPPVDDAMTAALLDMVKSASSPDIYQAQLMLLRRLAMEGDVIPSRVLAPKNISEIGGYYNLLSTLNEPAMREQMLAGILGIAGPNPPLGWLASSPPLAMTTVTNDRPEGAFQASIPIAFQVRSDFAGVLANAIAMLHNQGCQLPLQSNPYPLPASQPGIAPPADALPYLGRALDIVPATALGDPTTDPVALARLSGTAGPFLPAARVISPGAVAVAPASWQALKCDATQCTPQTIAAGSYVPLGPLLGAAGFYQLAPPPQPSSALATSWARFVNVTGLVNGVTRLGDELSLLYSTSEIGGSCFASALNWLWQSSKFSA